MKNIDKDLTHELQAFGWDASEQDVRELMSTILRAGGEWVEFFMEHTATTRVIYEGQKVDRILDGTDRGLSIRVLKNRRSWMGYTTDLSLRAVRALAKSLVETIAATGSSDSHKKSDQISQPALRSWRHPESVSKAMSEYTIAKNPRELPIAEKINMAKRADIAARQVLPDAQQITAVWMDSKRRTLVLNSDSQMAAHDKCYAHMVVQVVGALGDRVETAHESDGGFVGMEFFESTRTPEHLGKSAAERVKILLGSIPAPTGTMPVVLSAEAGGTMIHEAVGHGLEADLACNGLSVYEGKVGQTVASPLITVVDDGAMPARRGSYAVDDEGTPAQKNTLIENGVLKGFMVDRLSSMKFDLMATGNGRRESFRHKPIVRMTNTYVAPGKDHPDQILRDTKWGIFVKAMGGGQVNTVTGDFVFAVTEGYLIRDGKLGEAIRGATLVGNGPKVISIVDRVGTDLGFATGTCGKDGQGAPVTDAQPTMRIPEMIVGGEVPMDTYWK